jgi:hypothetical protein
MAVYLCLFTQTFPHVLEPGVTLEYVVRGEPVSEGRFDGTLVFETPFKVTALDEPCKCLLLFSVL